MKKNDKTIARIAGFAFVLVIGLSILVSYTLSSEESGSNSGLLKPSALTEAERRPISQTEEERQKEYSSREEMPAVTEEAFYSAIERFLSAGNFSALDDTLRHWQETYKDSTDESESKTTMIELYRGDIAYYRNVTASKSQALPAWQFYTPDTLAAGVAFSPIMKKYAAFISQDSLIIPAVSEGTNIHLRRSDMTNEEYAELKNDINRTRREETAFQQIAVYDMTIYGYPCQFIAVMDKDTMTWMPYSLEVTNNRIDLPTVSFGKEVLRNHPKTDLDTIIGIPAAISERPDGMEGNIDRTQESIPDSLDGSIQSITAMDDMSLLAEAESGGLAAEQETSLQHIGAGEIRTDPNPDLNEGTIPRT